jgi:Tol biopolymer transport system component
VTWIEWAYDGKRVAISATFYRQSTDIYVVSTDGSGAVRVKTVGPFAGSVYGADWSPDGGQLAFEDTESEAPQTPVSQIHVINADGSNEQALTSGTAQAYRPRWSPAGNQIAFLRDDRIWVMKPDGSEQHPITEAPLGNDPIWSPDGKHLAFSASATSGGKADIYTVNADGTGLRDLTLESSGDSRQPVWSPDGTEIAFQNGFFRLADIWIMNVDGSQKRNITRSPERYDLRDWQPIPGPKRPDYKSENAFCKAEQAFWGDQFNQRYRNFGQCVSRSV